MAREEDSFQRARAGNFKTPKFGDIQFPSTGLMTRFCILSKQASAERLCDMVIKQPSLFDLDAPKLILSVMGGAGGMKMTAAVKEHFCKGLVGAAKQTGGWVITGGTDSGVMDLVGQAMHQHDARRTVPCIGVTPFGALKKAWRGVLDESRSELFVAEAPALSKEDLEGEEAQLAGLQQHHTHCILADSGKNGKDAFGSEVDLRERLEQYVASGRYGARDPDETDLPMADVLRVMILVNGGPVSFRAIDNAIKNHCPVVVCRGSGRAADFIAAMRTRSETDYSKAWSMYMTAKQDVDLGLKGAQEQLGGEQALRDIVESVCLSVYTTEDRLEDVIARAVIDRIFALPDAQRKTEELKAALDLAVRWHCAKPKVVIRLLQELVKDVKDREWILNRFVKEWHNYDAGMLMRWLLNNQMQAIKEFHPPTPQTWSMVKLGKGADDFSAEATLANLFLWLVENQASAAVVDELWQHMEHPAHAALAAASVCRQAADTLQASGTYNDGLSSTHMRERGDRYEDLAIRVLTDMDRIDPLEYMFQRSECWGNHHLVSLAHLLECKQFVSQPFYNFAVDLLWQTPTPFAVFALDKGSGQDRIKERNECCLRAPMWDIVTGAYFLRPDRMRLRDFWSVPRIKAMTHGFSRISFILIYSYFVLFCAGLEWTAKLHPAATPCIAVEHILSVILFLWGIALALVEVLQFQAAANLREYITVWNALDILQLFNLLSGLLVAWTLVPWLVTIRHVQAVHALNLLPCYLRLLQIFELSEYFGTLLFTVFGMAKDTSQFLVLHGIMSLGFSCALTPILYPALDARTKQGVSWGFWAIFGEVQHENRAQDLPRWLEMSTSFLMYLLYLTSNVLLVNLLVAMLNDTYVANKDSSKREWAFHRVDAVMEFASPEAHILPPPLDLFVSLRALLTKGGGRSISMRLHQDGWRAWVAPIGKLFWWQFCSGYCVVEQVVPLGPRKVTIHYKAVGGDESMSTSSKLKWLDYKSSRWIEANYADHNIRSPRGLPKKDGQPPVICGELVFDNVQLNTPLRFQYGEGHGFRDVAVALDKDTWRRSLKPFERRAINALQKRVLVAADVDMHGASFEEKLEAKLTNFDQRLRSATEELGKVNAQLSDVLTTLRGNEVAVTSSTANGGGDLPKRSVLSELRMLRTGEGASFASFSRERMDSIVMYGS